MHVKDTNSIKITMNNVSGKQSMLGNAKQILQDLHQQWKRRVLQESFTIVKKNKLRYTKYFGVKKIVMLVCFLVLHQRKGIYMTIVLRAVIAGVAITRTLQTRQSTTNVQARSRFACSHH
jgi:hypothetical protein